MSAQQIHVTDITTPADVADALGDARALFAEAKARVDFLESLLKQGNQDIVNGNRYRVVISRDVETKRVGWKAVAEHFKPSRQLLTAHTTSSFSDRLRVSALNK